MGSASQNNDPWEKEARYIKENCDGIQYARHHVIDVGKPQKTYRATRGTRRKNYQIKEFIDWGNGGPFMENQYKSGPIYKNKQE